MIVVSLNEYLKHYKVDKNYVKNVYKEWLDFYSKYSIERDKSLTIRNNFRVNNEEFEFNSLYVHHECTKVNTYLITNDNKICGIFTQDDRFIDNIDSLTLSPESDWYSCIKRIFNFIRKNVNKKNIPLKDLSVIINSYHMENVMDKQIFFDQVIEDFKGEVFEYKSPLISKRNSKLYVIYFYKNIAPNNNLRLEIIGYDEHDKKKIIFEQSSNCSIYEWRDLAYHHYTILLEKSINFIKEWYSDIYLDLFIFYKGQKIQVHTNDSFLLRLNKIDLIGKKFSEIDATNKNIYLYRGLHVSKPLEDQNLPGIRRFKSYHKLLYECIENELQDEVIKRKPTSTKFSFPQIQGQMNFKFIDVINISSLYEN